MAQGSQTHRLWQRGSRRVVIFCLAWAVVMLLLQQFGLRALIRQELASLDLRFRFRGPQPPVDDVVILTIDQHSMTADTFTPEELTENPQLALLKNFPFPRRVYADLIQKACDAGARMVAFDLLFLTPKDDDELFRAAIEKYRGRVVVGSNFSDDNQQLMVPSVIVPESVTTESVAGFVNYWPDLDGGVRWARHRTTPAAVAGVAESANEHAVYSFASLAVRHVDQPHLINFVGPAGSVPTRPLYEVFYAKAWQQNLRNGEFFRGKTVLVGPAGNFQHDQHPTPFGVMDGVEIHANTIGTLLRDNAPRKAPLFVGQLTIVVLALATAWLLSVAGHPIGKLGLLAGTCVAYGVVAQVAFASAGIVLTVAAPVWTVAGSGVVGIAAQLVIEQLEKRRVRRTLDRYVSRQVAEEILKNTENYEQSLGGERRAITILFSDIRSFTSISEQSSPVELVQQLNEYLTAMVDVVLKHDGTLDKFIGDAIMSVYGAPTSRGPVEDAWRAVQTAYDMRVQLVGLQEQWRKAGKPELKIGIGLNHGEVVVGNIGSPHRMEYTVIGDPVNVASRVEGLNKECHTDILLTESVYDLVKNRIEAKFVAELAVKGRAQPVKVYSLEKLVG